MPAGPPVEDERRATADGRLLLVRHGESVLNAADCFTGRLDVPLTPVGVAQAHDAARLIADAGFSVDVVIASPMVRSRQTAEIIAGELHIPSKRVETAVELVERDYGALTGMPKARALAMLGPEEYTRVRRTLDGTPPPAEPGPLPTSWPLFEAAGVLPPAGSGEPLAAVVDRQRPWWEAARRRLAAGAGFLVVAHGNSLRALCLLVDHLSDREVQALNLPTCQPLLYRVHGGRGEPRGGHYLDLWNAHRQAARISWEGGT